VEKNVFFPSPNQKIGNNQSSLSYPINYFDLSKQKKTLMDLKSIVNTHYQQKFKQAPEWQFETIVGLGSNPLKYIGKLDDIKSSIHHSKKVCSYDICIQYIKKYKLEQHGKVKIGEINNTLLNTDNSVKNVFEWITGQYNHVIENVFHLNDSAPMRYYLTMAFSHRVQDVVSETLQAFIGNTKFTVKNGCGYQPLSIIGKQCVNFYLCVTFGHHHQTSLHSSEMMRYQRECMSAKFIAKHMEKHPFEKWIMHQNSLDIKNTGCWTDFFFALIGGIHMALSHEGLDVRAKRVDQILANHFGDVVSNMRLIDSFSEMAHKKVCDTFEEDSSTSNPENDFEPLESLRIPVPETPQFSVVRKKSK
jgi:hypothetical protein